MHSMIFPEPDLSDYSTITDTQSNYYTTTYNNETYYENTYVDVMLFPYTYTKSETDNLLANTVSSTGDFVLAGQLHAQHNDSFETTTTLEHTWGIIL